MHGIWLRIATKEDSEFMFRARLDNRGSFFEPAPSPETHEKFISNMNAYDQTKTFYIVMCGITPVGTISLDRVNRIEVYIGNVIILDKYRNRNYGSQLMDLVDKILKAEGKDILKLDVKGSNLDAIKFYHKNGFSLDHYSVMMRKVL